MTFEPRGIRLACLTECPPDRFLNQVLAVGVKAPRDLVDEVERLAFPGQWNLADDRGAAHPRVAIA